MHKLIKFKNFLSIFNKNFNYLHIILDEHKVPEQVNGENGVVTETVPACDIIRITGQPENVAGAKQALLDLVPITIQVSLYLCIVDLSIIKQILNNKI